MVKILVNELRAEPDFCICMTASSVDLAFIFFKGLRPLSTRLLLSVKARMRMPFVTTWYRSLGFIILAVVLDVRFMDGSLRTPRAVIVIGLRVENTHWSDVDGIGNLLVSSRRSDIRAPVVLNVRMLLTAKL